jgi:hypothetical protein
MPKSAAAKRKLVLGKETVRALNDVNGAAQGFVTTGGPTRVYTYCDCISDDTAC